MRVEQQQLIRRSPDGRLHFHLCTLNACRRLKQRDVTLVLFDITGRKQTTIWEEASPIAGFGGGGTEDSATAHPTQKPLALYTRPILNHTSPGEVVYDPFAGSGTALVAAEQHGRRALLIELDPAWCDVIRDRYQALTGAEH